MPAPLDVLRVTDARVAYDGRRPVLHGVSLAVGVGEVVAVLGANGSGKSTLIRAALGLVPTAAGRVELFGTPLRKFRDWQRLGYVPQRLGAGSGVPATVREVVAAGRLARRGFLRPPRAVDRTAVTEALDAVGLGDRADDPVSTLSGGQQQRVLIARALAGKPDLLVLDEPTAGVDAVSQEAFAAALRGFVAGAGTVATAGSGAGTVATAGSGAGTVTRAVAGAGTVVLVAHELGPLEQVVSRAVVVHQGRIVHDGAVPRPAGHHAEPDHDHVHPHGPVEHTSLWAIQ